MPVINKDPCYPYSIFLLHYFGLLEQIIGQQLWLCVVVCGRVLCVVACVCQAQVGLFA